MLKWQLWLHLLFLLLHSFPLCEFFTIQLVNIVLKHLCSLYFDVVHKAARESLCKCVWCVCSCVCVWGGAYKYSGGISGFKNLCCCILGWPDHLLCFVLLYLGIYLDSAGCRLSLSPAYFGFWPIWLVTQTWLHNYTNLVHVIKPPLGANWLKDILVLRGFNLFPVGSLANSLALLEWAGLGSAVWRQRVVSLRLEHSWVCFGSLFHVVYPHIILILVVSFKQLMLLASVSSNLSSFVLLGCFCQFCYLCCLTSEWPYQLPPNRHVVPPWYLAVYHAVFLNWLVENGIGRLLFGLPLEGGEQKSSFQFFCNLQQSFNKFSLYVLQVLWNLLLATY